MPQTLDFANSQFQVSQILPAENPVAILENYMS
jgi:hypothetical protein